VTRPYGGPPPEGARAAEVALLGTLLVSAGQQAIAGIVGVLGSWLSRRPDRTVKLKLGDDEIELTNASDEEKRQLVAAFLARNGMELG
jgi:Effector Associated Constant Component 1